MLTRYKILIAVGALAGLGAAAVIYYKKELNLLEQYETKLSNIKILSLSKDKVTMEIMIRFRNKSNIEAVIEHIYGDVVLNGVSVGFFNEVKTFVIPSNGENDIPISFTFSPQAVFHNLTDFLMTAAKNKDLPVRVKGYATVKSSFIRINIPYDYETTVKGYLFS